MHETVFCERIISEAQKKGKVKAIHLELGELAHVPPHELLETLKRLVPWTIHATEKKAYVMCSCGYQGEPTILERSHDAFMIECPQCNDIPELIDGFEIKIEKVVVEE